MPTIAYLSNRFPASLEPYVLDEIEELRGRGFNVMSSSVWQPEDGLSADLRARAAETLYVWPLVFVQILLAIGLCLGKPRILASLLLRAIREKREPFNHRAKCLVHTLVGAYYASLLGTRQVDHIHVHHGYFGSWVALTASSFLNATFSMTLHGSDLLVHRSYLASKLELCKFCLTISEYNRSQILARYPLVDPGKIVVQRLGVDIPRPLLPVAQVGHERRRFTLLNVGRLHPVKDHVFLLTACRELAVRGMDFECLIAGEGQERQTLERMIKKWDLGGRVCLLGQLSRPQLEERYRRADVFVLTSRSEGVPVVLMEAMAHGIIVVAPAITGIPELVRDVSVAEGNGFLYTPGSVFDLVEKIERVADGSFALERAGLRRAAYDHVTRCFQRKNNLAQLSDIFCAQIQGQEETFGNADPVLQQI